MAEQPADRFKPKVRRKAAPVKRVTMSPETKRAYEDLVRERDKRDKEHGAFLPDDRKGKA